MQLPPLQATRAVIQRYARLLHRYQSDLGQRPLILPSGEYFPDQFVGDELSVDALVRRMLVHSGMDDIPVETRVVSPEAPESKTTSSCGSGACLPVKSRNGFERLVDLEKSWLLQVPEAELRHPVALTTNLCRSLAFIFMVETQNDGEILEPPIDVTADFLAVALGFGPLMLQGSYIYAKGCGGPQVASVTKLPVGELAIATALFAALGKHRLAPALRELDVTQKALLAEAGELFRANKAVVDLVATSPGRAARQEFALDKGASLVAQWWARLGKKTPSSPAAAEIEPHMDLDEVEALLLEMPPSSRVGRSSRPPPLPADDEAEELKRLVAESLTEARP